MMSYTIVVEKPSFGIEERHLSEHKRLAFKLGGSDRTQDVLDDRGIGGSNEHPRLYGT